MANNTAYPLSTPLDMTQFNTITGGKSTYQEELLELFFQNTAECITIMEGNCTPETGAKWQKSLEELQNISGNIGAMELAKICAVAARMGNASEEEKRKMLALVKTNIQRLRAFIRNTRY